MEYQISPFDILNISENSTIDQIKERYKRMSATFHPDKQPAQYSNLTKQYFEAINKAYNSISTQLRKYVYYKYGVDGIELLERFSDQFRLLEGKEATIEGKQEIDQLIFNLHLQDKRDYLDDQGRVDAAVVIDISNCFKQYPEGFPVPTYPLPTVARMNSYYTLAAPSALSFQNNMIFQLTSHGQKASFGTGLISTRRIFNSILLRNFIAYGADGFFNSCSFEYFHSPTFSIRTTPFVYVDGQLMRPKIQFQKRLASDVSVGCQTNGQQHNASIYFPGKTKQSMNTNVGLTFKDYMQIDLEFDLFLSSFCRFVINFDQTYADSSAKFGISYGLVTNLTEDTKVTLLSHLSNDNYLQVKITSGKYNFKVPIACTTLDWTQFQLIKIAVLAGFYFGAKCLKYYRRNTSTKRQILKNKNQPQLKKDQSKLNVTIAQIQLEQIENLRFQSLSKGLIILASYVGNHKQINKLSRIINKKNISLQRNPISRVRGQLEFQCQQVINVTKLVQILVKGARIQHKILKVYNPCYDQTQSPMLYIYYNLRGKTSQLIQPLDKQINIGLPQTRRNNFITNTITWLSQINVIF